MEDAFDRIEKGEKNALRDESTVQCQQVTRALVVWDRDRETEKVMLGLILLKLSSIRMCI